MPISWTLNGEKRLVYVTLTAPYTRDQGLAAVKALTAHPEFASGFGFVVELIGRGDSAFVRDVLFFLATHEETFRNARIAIVITLGSRGAGNPPLSEMLAERPEPPMVVQVFRTLPRCRALARARPLIANRPHLASGPGASEQFRNRSRPARPLASCYRRRCAAAKMQSSRLSRAGKAAMIERGGTSAAGKGDKGCAMDEQTRESVIEITLHALDEVLPKGRLPRAETHKLLNDLITVVTRAKCGYRFDSKPFDQEIPCT